MNRSDDVKLAVRLLRHRSPAIRRLAACALSVVGDWATAVEPLANMVMDPNEDASCVGAASYAITIIQGPALIPPRKAQPDSTSRKRVARRA